MMDIKVLTAVFITLFGLAVGMAQGDVQVDDAEDVGGILDRLSSAGLSLDGLLSFGDGIGLPGGGGTEGPAPNTTLEASFTGEVQPFRFSTDRIDELRLSGSDAAMNVSRFTVGTDAFTVSLTNFSGTFVYNETVRLAGSADTIGFQDVPLRSSQREEVQLRMADLEVIEAAGFGPVSFQVSDIDGNFSAAGGRQRQLAAPQANVTSFEGGMTINASTGVTELDGRIYRARFTGDGFTTVLGGE